MLLQLFTSTSDENVIGKNKIKDAEFEINWKHTNDILMPEILLKSQSPITSNYAYLDTLQKYYFIDKIEFILNELYRLYLRVDVLETYKEEILKSYACITEQKQNVNPYYNSDFSFEVRKERDIIESDTVVQIENTNILVVIGG